MPSLDEVKLLVSSAKNGIGVQAHPLLQQGVVGAPRPTARRRSEDTLDIDSADAEYAKGLRTLLVSMEIQARKIETR